MSTSFIDSVVIYGANDAYNVTSGVVDVVNVDYDNDLMRLQVSMT
jgi:hypothetical protein